MAATYEDSTTIAASPQEVFAYVADVAHLPDYLPPITEAAPRSLAEGTETDPDVQDATGVHLVGEIKGHRFGNDGWFLADESARTLRWGRRPSRSSPATATRCTRRSAPRCSRSSSRSRAPAAR